MLLRRDKVVSYLNLFKQKLLITLNKNYGITSRTNCT